MGDRSGNIALPLPSLLQVELLVMKALSLGLVKGKWVTVLKGLMETSFSYCVLFPVRLD